VDLSNGDGIDGCSVVIVTAPSGRSGLDTLEQFLGRGGAVLSAAAYVAGLGGTTVRKEDLAYLVSDGDTVFPSVRLVDLGVEGQVPREAHHLRTPGNTHAVFAGALGGGVAVLLPFDPAHVLADTRTADRAFHARHDRLPTERVSRVSRGEISSLIHSALAFLHHIRSNPYAHLWYYPGTRRNVFSFRIDTDGSARNGIDGLYGMLRAARVPATWFLDVAAHETWLSHFGSFEGHEIGLHCYRHRIHGDMHDQEADWHRGLALIRAAGFSPAGMAAPFGTWTPALAEVIDRLGLTYSSEFSYAYDTVPMMPYLPAQTVRTLQVPVHPVSTGSLRRAGFSTCHMKEYFIAAADALLARDLPLFFYHHPTQHIPGVFEALFEHVRALGIVPIRMNDMARWWLGRGALKPSLRIDGDILEVGSDAGMRAADVAVRVTFPSGEEALVAARTKIELRSLASYPRAEHVVPGDIRATREFDPRRAFSDLFISLLRRFV
jgi:peptidoglycan/xylan/chitin deacetylase (PgdA/CDA1 family)